MRRRVLGMVSVAAAALLIPASALATASLTTLRVAPSAIHPSTDVVVRFTQPRSTGVLDGERLIETVRIAGPTRPGCVNASTMRVAAADAGTHEHLRLDPSRLGGRWCAGVYRGWLVLEVEPACTITLPVHACPMWILAPRTLGSFRFRVTAR